MAHPDHLSLVSDNDNPTPATGPCSAGPAPIMQPAGEYVRSSHRQLIVRTQYASARWRELARKHEAARGRLNATLEPPPWRRRADNLALLPTDSIVVDRARKEYQQACLALLSINSPRLRHLPCLIRAVAELLELPDPAWSVAGTISANGEMQGGEGRPDIVFRQLYCLAWRIVMEAEA